MARITQAQGRNAFGADPAGYDAGRPDYPPELITHLKRYAGLASGLRIFEVGPGPGRFTERVALERPKALVAIEPDPRLAAYTAKRLAKTRGASVLCSPFEEAVLEPGSFDLGLAATSFHWVDTRTGLAKVFEALRPGGAWAMWWNIYGEAKSKDPFARATDHLFKDIPRTPSHKKGRRQAYGLQVADRTAELKAAGFVKIHHRTLSWRVFMTSEQLVALMATFSPILLMPDAKRKVFLSRLRAIADEKFGGNVERVFQTAIYTARKPLRASRQARN